MCFTLLSYTNLKIFFQEVVTVINEINLTNKTQIFNKSKSLKLIMSYEETL
jgi:hypothetical protein